MNSWMGNGWLVAAGECAPVACANLEHPVQVADGKDGYIFERPPSRIESPQGQSGTITQYWPRREMSRGSYCGWVWNGKKYAPEGATDLELALDSEIHQVGDVNEMLRHGA